MLSQILPCCWYLINYDEQHCVMRQQLSRRTTYPMDKLMKCHCAQLVGNDHVSLVSLGAHKPRQSPLSKVG